MNPEEIVQRVKYYAEALGGEFNLTPKGVPRIIINGADMKLSLVYVARSNIWKAFLPYPSNKQEKEYFQTTDALVDFLMKKGCKLP